MSNPESMQANHRILIVDDNEAIHNDLRKVLTGGIAHEGALQEDEAILFGEPSLPATCFEIDSAFQGQEALSKLEQALAADKPYALAFVDIRMPPGWDGVETISRLWQACADLQVVICTAYSDYSWEKMVRRLGYSENLIILKKPFDNIEVLQLAHALTRKWLVTRQAHMRMEDLDRLVAERTRDLQAANENLIRSEERFAKAFSASPIPLAIQDAADSRFLDFNARFLEITGISRDSALGRTPEELLLFPRTQESEIAALLGGASALREYPCTFRNCRGEIREALLSTEILQLGQGAQRLFILQDIAEKVRLENRLRQAQKMEAVGKLAGGVAHHFNNLHTVIQGNVALCQYQIQDPQLQAFLENVMTASDRAARLTGDLLAFSSRQMLRPRPLDLGAFLERLRPELLQILGSGIELAFDLAPRAPAVLVDAESLQWALHHLCTNARDAMPAGGRWALATEAVQIEGQDRSAGTAAADGLYVCLSAADTGVGMEPAVLDRIFEPFFTTKEVGKGDGLGLASIYGIVKQQQGWMEVSSRPGHGSTFRMYLTAAKTQYLVR